MACHAIHSWTFCGLVGAFLDLALAYLMLCGSALAFFASKFLGLFGLCLPCPCNGLFGVPYSGKCLQKLLVDSPSGNISSVQMSVKGKFPFDSIWMKDDGCQLNVKLVTDEDHGDGAVALEGEVSCRSFSDMRPSQSSSARDALLKSNLVGFGSMNSPAMCEGKAEVMGKGIISQKQSSGLRQRHAASFEFGKFSSVSSSDPSCLNARGITHSHNSVGEMRNEITEEISVPMNSGRNDLQNDSHLGTGLGERILQGFEVKEPLEGGKAAEKDTSSVGLAKSVSDEMQFERNRTNEIRELEQSLEEEYAARAALYLELEKERSAAATAADEAMAMIQRLQEEKATIEMEAWQYQRMIEEKSAYDSEEMNILKEILVRREKEKHFLEKEVKAYRQMLIVGKEQMDGYEHDMADSAEQGQMFSLDMSEDPVLMLQRLSESISKKKVVTNANSYSEREGSSVYKETHMLTFGKELPKPDHDEDDFIMKQRVIHGSTNIDKYHPSGPQSQDELNQEFQEKGMVSDRNPSFPQMERQMLEVDADWHKLRNSEEHISPVKTVTSEGENHDQKDNTKLNQGMAINMVKDHKETNISLPYDGEDVKMHGKDVDQGGSDPCHSALDNKTSFLDVHVIDCKSNMHKGESSKGSEQMSIDAALTSRSKKCDLPFEIPRVPRFDIFSDHPRVSERSESEPDICTSSSEMTARLPPLGNSQSKTSTSILRRNSMSAMDIERLKLDNEIEWLREKLRMVQEGREKLSFSVEHREREKIQLQLLEDIARQIREIRRLTDPGKSERQASLPPTSSKVSLKKRRYRSGSWGVHERT